MTTSKPRTTKPGKAPAKKQPDRVRIHDLTSFAIFSLPEASRQIFGDEWYDRQVRELQDTELVLVLRGPQDVVYLRMPLLTFAGPDTRVMQFQSIPTPKASSKPPAKPASKATRRARGPR